MTLGEFAEAVTQYCAMTRASVTSWGRTTRRNEQVDGVPYSAHRFFRAVDVIYDDAFGRLERERLAAAVGLRLIIEADHDHLQPLDWPKG